MFSTPEPLDDVLTFLITIGSPALAIYSLQITHLNARWITKEFLDVSYPNSKLIPTVLSAFHHIPIKISDRPHLLHSLIILPENDGFWKHLREAAKQTRRWSIPLIMNFALVIFAVILTTLDSSYTPDPGDVGYGIVAIWTFLLPLVIGWLRVGCEPEPNHLRNSLEEANKKTRVATAQRNRTVYRPLAIEFMEEKDIDSARKDELKTTPVFNYSRAFVSPLTAELILGLVKNAAANAEKEIPVGDLTSRGPPAWADDVGDTISNENRTGTVDQVTVYCTTVLPDLESGSNPITPLDTQLSETTSTTHPLLPLHDPPVSRNPSRWATGIWKRVALASALALGLQWGTTGAAVVIHYATPPVGLGCRAFSFLMYGVAGTVSFLLFLLSSILAHMSRPYRGRRDEGDLLRAWQNAGAIIFLWLGKGIAIASAMGILLVCVFQTTGAFNNCFCTSTTFDRGTKSVWIPVINWVVGPTVIGVWIGGLAMAFSAASLFGFSMYLGTPPRR